MNKIVHSVVGKNYVRFPAASLDIVAINYTIDIFIVKTCHCKQFFLQSIATEEKKKQTHQFKERVLSP